MCLAYIHILQRTRILNTGTCPGGGSAIHCVNGTEVGGSQSCKAACDANGAESCCVDPLTGNDACVGFTGSVCPDGSCLGVEVEGEASLLHIVRIFISTVFVFIV